MEINKVKIVTLVILVIIAMFITYSVGYANGSQDTIKWVLKIAKHFTTVEINEDMLSAGIYNYKNNINACFSDVGNFDKLNFTNLTT